MSRKFVFTYFPYPAKDPQTGKFIGEIFRPTIPIYISNKSKKTYPFQALVDSGSDRNLFPAELGELVAIDIKSGKEYAIYGIGDHKIVAYTHLVKLCISNFDYAFETEIDFSYEHKVPLLGRNGFFNLFKKVEFREKKKEIEFKF